MRSFMLKYSLVLLSAGEKRQCFAAPPPPPPPLPPATPVHNEATPAQRFTPSPFLVDIIRESGGISPLDWGGGSFHRATVHLLDTLQPTTEVPQEDARTTVDAAHITRSTKRDALFSTLISVYADVASRSGEALPPPKPVSGVLSDRRHQQELAWYLEELPLMQSAQIVRTMAACILKGSPRTALALFSRWCGWHAGAQKYGGFPALSPLFAPAVPPAPPNSFSRHRLETEEPEISDFTLTYVPRFAETDARRHHESFPFDNTCTMRAGEGGLLGATPHVKSALFPLVWATLTADAALSWLAASRGEVQPPPPPNVDDVRSFLPLVQRWWAHALVPHEEWSSIQQFLLEVAAGAIADVVVKRASTAQVVQWFEMFAPPRRRPTISGHHDTAVGRPVVLHEHFWTVFRAMSDAIEWSWSSAGGNNDGTEHQSRSWLHRDLRIASWFSAERQRIGEAALTQFARHRLFQRENSSLRYFNASQPWIRMSLELFGPTAGDVGGQQRRSHSLPSTTMSIADMFRGLWLLLVIRTGAAYGSDAPEWIGRQSTISRWFHATKPPAEDEVVLPSHEEDNAVDNFLAAAERARQCLERDAAVEDLLYHPEEEETRQDQAPPGGVKMLSTPPARGVAHTHYHGDAQPQDGAALHLVKYHSDPVTEATHLIRVVLYVAFSRACSAAATQHCEDGPSHGDIGGGPLGSNVQKLVALYLTALSQLADLGDVVAAESLLSDIRTPPPQGDRRAGVDEGGEQLDRVIGPRFVRALARSGSGTLPEALVSWWRTQHQHSTVKKAQDAGISGEEGDNALDSSNSEGHRVIFYYWAHTMSDGTAASTLFQSLLWQPANVALCDGEGIGGGRCRVKLPWLSFVLAFFDLLEQVPPTVDDVGQLAGMVRTAWEYISSLALSRDVTTPTFRRSSHAALPEEDVLRHQALLLMDRMLHRASSCVLPRDSTIDSAADRTDVGTTAVDGSVSSRKRRLLVTLDLTWSKCDAENISTSPCSPLHTSDRTDALRGRILATLQRHLATNRGGDAPQPTTDHSENCLAQYTAARGAVDALFRYARPAHRQQLAVLEKLLAAVFVLYWHDVDVMKVCLPLALVGSDAGGVSPRPTVVAHVRPLLVAILCRQLVLKPYPPLRQTVELFLRDHVFCGTSQIDGGDDDASVTARVRTIKDLVQSNFYVAEVYRRFILDEPRPAPSATLVKAATSAPAVVFPSLQLQDGRSGVLFPRSAFDTKRCAVLPFSLLTRLGNKVRPEQRRRRGGGIHPLGGNKSVMPSEHSRGLSPQTVGAATARRSPLAVVDAHHDAFGADENFQHATISLLCGTDPLGE